MPNLQHSLQRSGNNTTARKRDKGEGQAIDFNTKVVDNISSLTFKGFEQDPEKAALLYYANSGHTTFWPMHFLLDENGTIVEEQFNRIKEEIQDQVLTDSEIEDLLYKFYSNQGKSTASFHASKSTTDQHSPQPLPGLPPSLDAHKLACGVCGIQAVHGLYGKHCTTVALQDLPCSIQLSEMQLAAYRDMASITVPMNEKGDTKNIDLCKLKSVYESPALNKCFHLHPEFVHWHDKQEMTVLCPACTEWYQSTKIDTKKGKKRSSYSPPVPLLLASILEILSALGYKNPPHWSS